MCCVWGIVVCVLLGVGCCVCDVVAMCGVFDICVVIDTHCTRRVVCCVLYVACHTLRVGCCVVFGTGCLL